jgi:hypothetical protein
MNDSFGNKKLKGFLAPAERSLVDVVASLSYIFSKFALFCLIQKLPAFNKIAASKGLPFI